MTPWITKASSWYAKVVRPISGDSGLFKMRDHAIGNGLGEARTEGGISYVPEKGP